jgi:beta-lactamase class A
MKFGSLTHWLAPLAAAAALIAPVAAQADAGVEGMFDSALGTQLRAPPSYRPDYSSPLVSRIAQIADGSQGRIGVAAVDLASGEEVAVLGDQLFPMASTSKIAIAAAFLEGVDQGRWSLTSEFPLLIPVRSERFAGSIAPVRAGEVLPAMDLIERMIVRSDNAATDALLKVVGGPAAVNGWVQRAGIRDFQLSRDIATLVRDDGEFDPATIIDRRDSATPRAMVQLLAGLHQGRWLSQQSRMVLIGAMERCKTGTRRIPALMPANVLVAHKTGSLNNTSSDVGILTLPDGRSIALAIYVTGQGAKGERENRIAQIARAIHDGFSMPQPGQQQGREWVSARYNTP